MRSLYWCLCWMPQLLCAQVGGQHIYEFLRLSPSARVSGLGSGLISVKDGDLGLAWQNPALLNEAMHQQIHVQQSVYVAGLSFGNVSYGHHLKTSGLSLQGGLQYLSYGRFQRTTPEGEELGEFRMADYALHGSLSYALTERLRGGVTVRGILSYLEDYNSAGLSTDLGLYYEDTARLLGVALVLRHLGRQVTTYSAGGSRESLPFDLQLGLSHRLRHLPLRLSTVAHHLHRWDIRYDNPNLQNQSGLFAPPSQPSRFAKGVDNFFRHFIFNAELLLGKRETVVVRLGYNHLRAAEMRVSGLRSISGFSLGFGLRLGSALHFDYGFGAHHFAGGLHHFGLAWRF